MPPVQKPFASTAVQPMLGTLSTLNPAAPAPGSTQSWLGALALQNVCVLAEATLGTAKSTSIASANDSSLATRIVDLLAVRDVIGLDSDPSFVLSAGSSQRSPRVSNGTNCQEDPGRGRAPLRPRPGTRTLKG